MSKTKASHEQGSGAPAFYNDISMFLAQTAGRIYRFWVYKKVFTPYEIESQFIDESQYESSHARFGVIQEAIVLPNKDVLLGIGEITDHISDLHGKYFHRVYYRLSDICLEHHPSDQEEFHVELQ